MSTLQSLAKIMSDGIIKIESACAAHDPNCTYPLLDDPYDLQTSTIQNQCAVDAAPVIAAAWQTIATLSQPNSYVFNWGISSFYSAAIAAMAQGGVPDILREAGPQGMHVKDIVAKNAGMDAGKVERMLRFLASRHIFTEVSPCVFCNNRLSAALCTGKKVEEMYQRPIEKWDDTNGLSAMSEFLGTVGAKMAAFLVDNLADKTTGLSQEPIHSPVQRAFHTDLGFFNWLQLPENALYSRSFQHAMLSLTGFAANEHTRGGFEWERLPAGSLVVDVGGGLGTVTVGLSERYKHLRYVIQDLPAVIAQTREVALGIKHAACLGKDTVTLQEYEFFDEQPIKDASVYILRFILHNWSDAYCSKILKRLREAVSTKGSGTHLIVLDHILDHLCRAAPGGIEDIPGAMRPQGPLPLLPYPESVAGYAYGMDMLMMGELNAEDRTLGHLVELLRNAGWKVERVWRFPAPHPQQLVCTPV